MGEGGTTDSLRRASTGQKDPSLLEKEQGEKESAGLGEQGIRGKKPGLHSPWSNQKRRRPEKETESGTTAKIKASKRKCPDKSRGKKRAPNLQILGTGYIKKLKSGKNWGLCSGTISEVASSSKAKRKEKRTRRHTKGGGNKAKQCCETGALA